MAAQGPGQWVRENENVLIGLCVVVFAAFAMAVPFLGWTAGIGSIVGAAGWVAVCAVVNREERAEHDARDRMLLRRPS